MNTLDSHQLARLGAKVDPYPPKSAIDPFTTGMPCDLLARVSSFEQLDRIDARLHRAIDEERPAYLLVTGRSGSGRSSMANCIMARYCHHRNLPLDHFILPNRNAASNCAKLSAFKAWFTALRNDIFRRKLSLSKNLTERIPEYLKESDDDTMEANFQYLALEIAEELRAIGAEGRAPYLFGCCLEDVKSYAIIKAALDIFREVQTVCIFTVGDYDNERMEIIDLFRTKHVGERFVQLHPLLGHDASRLLQRRWELLLGSDCPFPFDADELATALGDKPRTVGKILTLMNIMLQMKLNSTPPGEPWPHDPALRFTAAELRNIAVLDAL